MSQTLVVPVPALRRIIAGAASAPSVRNTKPWRWRASADVLELFADRSRRLPSTDPDGRDMVISCGAALHHAQAIAAALGWSATVTRRPDPERPDLLARLDLASGTPAPGGDAVLAAVEQEGADPRPPASRPVPREHLEHLAAAATTWGTIGRALTDRDERSRVDRLISRAATLQGQDRAAVSEQEAWIARATPEGFAPPGPVDGLVMLLDRDDTPESWLRAGEGLSTMWLAAAEEGMSIVPLPQVIEVTQTREALRAEVLDGLGHPLLLVGVGWQPTGRTDLQQSPLRVRRPDPHLAHGH
ncbi:nitroreductase [Nocardioides sp. zg-1228]|uniref:nitroreductase n=1 Tax=Nocardioides sp. zg-1228 TaxID=2763008 RepID=UPI0016425A9B|nr:nitroreductase [Nocardioides sp. zg-1228]MBC2935161.1 nitroreductase [Nocardioides sp. zg-1228]QSF56103.1 hypothetical protein JX575_10455 [Nocardioides sp. zg-1228]